MAASHNFKCPKCKHKSLARFTPNSLVIQGVSEFYLYNNTQWSSNAAPTFNFSQRVFGEPSFEPIKNNKTYWGCKHKSCDFVLPVKSTAELFIWLLDNNMLDHELFDREKITETDFINTMVTKGEISQDFLNKRVKKIINGPYVPPVPLP